MKSEIRFGQLVLYGVGFLEIFLLMTLCREANGLRSELPYAWEWGTPPWDTRLATSLVFIWGIPLTACAGLVSAWVIRKNEKKSRYLLLGSLLLSGAVLVWEFRWLSNLTESHLVF